MKVYLDDPGKTVVDLDRSPFLAKGGEALVYQLPRLNSVFKLYKKPDHPDYQKDQTEQDMAQERLIVHRQKLPALKALHLPSNVIKPNYLGYESKNVRSLCGFAMPFVDGTGPILQLFNGKFQRSMRITKNHVLTFLLALHETVTHLHRSGVVIGDFNPLNVLFELDVANDIKHHMIDTDSYQFRTFFCNTFTFGYTDPLRCNQDMKLIKPHTSITDWYAFTVMVMQALLFTGPFDGTHKPKSGKRLRGKHRINKRITVFDPDVTYPKPADDYTKLPDDLLHYFTQVFQHDHRVEFPIDLLQFQWTTCTKCKTEHARPVCPQCTNPSPVAVVQKVTVKDGVTATRVFLTEGTILHATVEGGGLKYVYQLKGEAFREDHSKVYTGNCAALRYRIGSDFTYMGRGKTYFDAKPNSDKFHVDNALGEPVFDTTGNYFYWVQEGTVYRKMRRPKSFIDQQMKEHIAGGIPNQTMIYMGKDVGLGWYVAGALPVVYVIHPEAKGSLNIQMGAINGQLINHACHFGSDRIWFFLHYVKQGVEVVRCTLIRHNGTVDATFEESLESDSWFKNIHGMCGIGPYLFVPTDAGIARVEHRGRIDVTKEFTATEPFVNSESKLLPGKQGIYVIDAHQITLLKL